MDKLHLRRDGEKYLIHGIEKKVARRQFATSDTLPLRSQFRWTSGNRKDATIKYGVEFSHA